MKYVNITGLKQKTAEVVGDAQTDTVMLMKRGKPIAVLMSINNFRVMQATMALARNPERLKKFNEDYEKVRKGDFSEFIDLDELEKKIS